MCLYNIRATDKKSGTGYKIVIKKIVNIQHNTLATVCQ